MNFKLLSALAFVSLVAAQSDTTTVSAVPSGTEIVSTTTVVPSGAPGPAVPIPECVQTCLDQSGCDATDVTCACTTGLESVTSCVTSNCTPEEQQAAASLQQTLCPATSGGMSGGLNSTMVTGSATTQDATLSGSTITTVPAITNTLMTSSGTLTPRPLSSNLVSSSSTSTNTADASNNSNAAVPQNVVTQGIWVMLASLIGVAVAA